MPDAILVIAGNSVAALTYADVQIGCHTTQFIEERPPADAQVVGNTWKYVNKDGTRDRRFKGNRQIPICLYGEIDLRSASGLNERIHCSRFDRANEFVAAVISMRDGSSEKTRSTATAPDASSMQQPGTRRSDAQPKSEALDPVAVFEQETEKARTLALEHGKFWQVLLVQELLDSKLLTLKKEYGELDKVLPATACHFDAVEFLDFLNAKLTDIGSITEKISKCVNVDLPSAMGKTGVSGDAIQILSAVNALFDCCRDFLECEREIRASDPPANLKTLATSFRGITRSLADCVQQFADRWRKALENVMHGSTQFNVSLTLEIPQIHKLREQMATHRS